MAKKYNDPQTYGARAEEMERRHKYRGKGFPANPEEKIKIDYLYFHKIPYARSNTMLQEIDRVIVESVAVMRYLTRAQIWEVVNRRGFKVDQSEINKRIGKLGRFRYLQQEQIVKGDEQNGLKFYEIGLKGFQLASQRGVRFHKGNVYISRYKRREEGTEDVKPADVKRVLEGNDILLSLLSKVPMKRFGVMETLRLNGYDYKEKVSLIRTAINVQIDDNSVLAYEVVRDTPEAYEKLADKISRYYHIVRNPDYLEHNHHGHTSYPQLIICGECYEHNKKIRAFLKERGLINTEDTLLFTEDMLCIKNILVSIYEFDEDGNQRWYKLPEKESDGRETA